MLVAAIAYILLFGKKTAAESARPRGRPREDPLDSHLWNDYKGERELRQLKVEDGSAAHGKTMTELELSESYGTIVSGIRRARGTRWLSVGRNTELRAGDTLIAAGRPDDLSRLQSDYSLEAEPFSKPDALRRYWEIGAATTMVHPESTHIGQSLKDIGFRDRYGVQAFGLRRGGEPLADYDEIPLQASDSLLVIGQWQQIQKIPTSSHDFVMLESPAEKTTVVPAYTKRPLALGILAAMVLLSIFNVVPLVAAVIMAVMAAVLTGCVTMEGSYRAVSWSSLVLLAGMLPLADALESTGGTKIIVDVLMGGTGSSAPLVVLSVIFFLTAALSLFLSNTAAAVLVAPIAISSAESLGVSPYPFALAVLIAASAAFSTPVSTPVVTLVVEPGKYRFIDFVKIGVPLVLITYLVTLLLAPLIFPL